MVELKITQTLASDLLALKKAADVRSRKSEEAGHEGIKRADEAVRVDVDPRIEKLAHASPPTEQSNDEPAVNEQAARQLALDVAASLKDANQPFAARSEKVILSLFG